MPFELDHHSGIPIYIQLRNAIKMAIATGLFPPGSKLPTVRQFAVELKVNPNTVSRVYSELEHEGFLSTRQGKGTFVTAQPDVFESNGSHQLDHLLDALLLEAGRMGFTPNQVLETLKSRLTKI